MLTRTLPWLAIPLFIGLLAAAQVWLSHVRYELSQNSQRIMADKQDIALETSKLRLEIASLTRPERLRRLAQQRLHMAPPRPMQVIRP
ncbi:MAG: cell division protein FtsL [Mariprofundaceae bacterium]